MGVDLPLLWALIIAFAVMMYVTLDGFDLGIGILLPFVPLRDDRDVMINTVAPVWDGNETWLVLGGAGLLAAFPLAYSVILSALYLPLIAMLAGLICRGVAFEFRFKAGASHRRIWDGVFAGGSCTAAFCQGMALGAFINGFAVSNHAYAGGAFDWLTPFSLFTGLGVLVSYALLGSTWLVLKTEGQLQEHMRSMAQRIALCVLAAILVISVWTPLTHQAVAARWFSFPNILFFSPVPVLVLLFGATLFISLRRGSEVAPFVLALLLLFLGYSGLAISVWPHIIPPAISIWDAAGPPQSLGFVLVGALFVIPFILVYTSWSYFVFRGKVRAGEGYHE